MGTTAHRAGSTAGADETAPEGLAVAWRASRAVGAPVWRNWAAKTLSACAIGLAGALLCSACATAPIPHEVDRSRTFDQSKDEIWERAVAFFAAHNLSIKTIEKASGIIAVDRAITAPTAGLEGYADCGTDPLMRNISQTIDLNLFVRPLPDGRTSVTVNSRFTETRIYGYNMMTARTVTWVSTGKLEDDILNALVKPL